MSELSQEKIAEIKENFDHFDEDANGRIDFFEYTKLLGALDAGMDAQALRAGFAHIDSDKNGEIDFEEFLGWWGERYIR